MHLADRFPLLGNIDARARAIFAIALESQRKENTFDFVRPGNILL